MLCRASELDRLLACPGSLLLDRHERVSGPAAEWGTAAHLWKETGEFPDTRDGRALKKKVAAGGVDRGALWAHGLHEVPLAYNVVTEEALALVIPVSLQTRDEWKGGFDDNWITGTADYAGELMDVPWVDDLKTGRRVDYLDHRYQQGFYALAWTLFSLKASGGLPRGCRSTITHWPRYPLAQAPLRFGVVLDGDFFMEFKQRLRKLRDDVVRLRARREQGLDITAALSDGGHCLYCPSKPSCVKGNRYV